MSPAGRCLRIAPLLLVLLPPVGLAILIARHAVNIPFLDDWMFVEMLDKAMHGRLTVHDFFMAQMEHRIAFVRLVILVRHWLSPHDLRPQMGFSWLLIAGTAWNVSILLRHTFGAFQRWWVPMLLSSMILFTPLQHQIVLWSMMFQVACPAFFLSSALVALLSEKLPEWARFAICAVGAECATLSFASGLQIWVLAIPMILLAAPFRSRRQRLVFLGLWAAVFVTTVGLYFHNLKNEADPAFSYGAGSEETMGKHVGGFLSDPIRGVKFALAFLGGTLARGTSAPVLELSQWIGGASLLTMIAFCIVWLRHFRDEEIRRRWLPWILFGGYSIGTAVLTALGRAWATNNGDTAIAARYEIHTIPLTVSLIALGCLAAEEWMKRRPQCERRACAAQFIAGTALSMLFTNGWVHGTQIMAVWESSRLRGAASTLFFDGLLDTQGDVAPSRPRAVHMNNLGLLNPPMLKDLKLSNFKISTERLSRTTARLDHVVAIGNKIHADGVAALQGRKRPADAVLLTYRADDGQWMIFHVTQVQQMPLYLDQSLDRDLRFTHVPDSHRRLAEALTSFEGTCSFSRLPPGRHPLRAWVLDYKKQTVFLMDGRFIVDSEAREIRELE